MATIEIPVHLNRYGNHTETDHVLAVPGRRGGRFKVIFFGPEHEGRQVFQGPMVPGPWASPVGLCTVIDNFGGTAAEAAAGRAAGTEHPAAEGDDVVITWQDATYRFQLERDRHGDLKMILVDG